MFRNSHKPIAATLLFVIGATAAVSNADAKSSIACGSIYTVSRGETLYRIADRAYSDGRLYKKIFKANEDLLPNMQSVEIGDQLLIPCLDGTGPATRRAAMVPMLASEGTIVAGFVEFVNPIEIAGPFVPFGKVEPLDVAESAKIAKSVEVVEPTEIVPPFNVIEAVEITAADPMAIDQHIRILSSSGFAPYADKHQPSGGMMTDLISRGVKNVAPERKLSVSFVNDWEAHLVTLLPGNSYDVSFPWVKPECSNPMALSEMGRTLCTDYSFSDPFFGAAVGYYTRAGEPLIAANDTRYLRGKVVCRPEGQFQFGPTEVMLPSVIIETGKTAEECLARLVEGKVDVVNLVKSDNGDELHPFNDADQVAEMEGLATTLTLHAVVAKSNPDGWSNLGMINQGLADLMASGEWFEVVVRHRIEIFASLN